MAKKRLNTSGLVYSTDPEFKLPGDEEEDIEIPQPAQQLIRVRLETKHRAGKAVTLVDNFIGTDAGKETLGKQIKTYCGTGGSVKDGEIIIQGDHREKVLQWLLKNGYTKSKKG